MQALQLPVGAATAKTRRGLPPAGFFVFAIELKLRRATSKR
jgi:hypothetical protein